MDIENGSAMAEGSPLALSQASFRSRIGHLALLLGATGGSVVVGSLLATEGGLSMRTTVALGILLVINLSWVAFAVWVLAAHRAMLFNHRVVAGRIAVAAVIVFTSGAAVLAALTRSAASYAATGSGLVLLAVAMTLLMRAKRDFRALQLRRAELEARLVEIA